MVRQPCVAGSTQHLYTDGYKCNYYLLYCYVDMNEAGQLYCLKYLDAMVINQDSRWVCCCAIHHRRSITINPTTKICYQVGRFKNTCYQKYVIHKTLLTFITTYLVFQGLLIVKILNPTTVTSFLTRHLYTCQNLEAAYIRPISSTKQLSFTVIHEQL